MQTAIGGTGRRIFVSYRRADNSEFVKRIRDWFIHRYGRDNVFMDFDSIPPFVSFADFLRDKVRESDVMIVIIGPRWLELLREKAQNFEEDYVRVELELGLQEQKLMAPICILGASPPPTAQLPSSLQAMLAYNVAFLDDDRGFYEGIDVIMRGVEAELERRQASQRDQLAQTDIHEAMDRFWQAYDSEDWQQAHHWLRRIRAFAYVPPTFDMEALEKEVLGHLLVDDEARQHMANAERDYEPIRRMVKRANPDRNQIWRALQVFWQTYPDYDPDHLGQQFRQELPRQLPLSFVHPPLVRWLKGETAWTNPQWQQHSLEVALGLYDAVDSVQQLPLHVDLMAGHIAVIGAPASGKTTLLRAMLTSLVTQYTPEHVQFYVVDDGGHLSFAADFPHVGVYIRGNEVERLERLMRYLEQVLEQRKKALGEARQDNLHAYNALQHTGATLPHIVVLFDNFGDLRNQDDVLLETLTLLLRNGHHYGIHFVITTLRPSELGGRVSAFLTQRLVLRQTDLEDYQYLLGIRPEPHTVAGRGYITLGQAVVTFQTAIPILSEDGKGAGDASVASKLSALAAHMNHLWGQQPRPPRIEVLPSLLSLDMLDTTLGDPTTQFVIGLEDLDLQPLVIDCAYPFSHVLVVGPPLSGRTTTLQTIILSLATHATPDAVRLVLIDPLERLWKLNGEPVLASLPHVAATTTSPIWLERTTYDPMVLENELGIPTEAPEFNLTDFLPKNNNDPHLWILIDNLDLINDRQTEGLAEYLRRERPERVHVVVAAENTRSMGRQLINQVISTRRIIATNRNAAENITRLPRNLQSAILPTGRGFAILHEQAYMVQIAQHRLDEPTIAGIVSEAATRLPSTTELDPRTVDLTIHADVTRLEQALTKTRSDLGRLESGAWVGQEAAYFYKNMHNEVLPMMTRLYQQLEHTQALLTELDRLSKPMDE